MTSVSPDALDELLTLAGAGLTASRFASALVEGVASATAQEQGKKTTEALLKICQRLEALGAQDLDPVVKPAPVNPLVELARMEGSRTEAIRLLEVLRVANTLAADLDKARGDAGGDWEERLLNLRCALELDLFGPSVPGGRE